MNLQIENTHEAKFSCANFHGFVNVQINYRELLSVLWLLMIIWVMTIGNGFLLVILLCKQFVLAIKYNAVRKKYFLTLKKYACKT